MENRARLTLEHPAPGKLDIVLYVPALAEIAASCGVAPDQTAPIVGELFMLTTSGRIEVSGRDLLIVVSLLRWLSSQLPRTKIRVRMEGEDRSRGRYEFHKGGVTEPDAVRPPPKAASMEIEQTLQQATARPYSAKTHYATGEVVEHPSFGRGLVTRLVEQKIVVQFLDAERTLVHAR